MRDAAGLLVGWGMGTALFPAPMFTAEARAVLRADGTALVETSAADMGQGAWTALAQIAADGLGLHIDQVEFRAGHSDHPDGGVAGGSGHTATAGGAVFSAGSDAVARLAELATAHPDSPLFGAGNGGVEGRRRAAAPPRRPAAAARATPTSSPAPGCASSRAAAAAPATRRTRRPGRCSRTARFSPR